MQEVELARQLYGSGYSCAEATWLAIAKDVPEADRNLGLKLSGGFGGGVSCGGLCGALGGAVMGLGLFLGRNVGEPRPDQLRAVTKELCAAFAAKFGSIDCRDIKPAGPDSRTRCGEFVAFCVEESLRLLDESLAADDCG